MNKYNGSILIGMLITREKIPYSVDYQLEIKRMLLAMS